MTESRCCENKDVYFTEWKQEWIVKRSEAKLYVGKKVILKTYINPFKQKMLVQKSITLLWKSEKREAIASKKKRGGDSTYSYTYDK